MLPHSASGKLKIPLERLPCLLDEAVKKYHAPPLIDIEQHTSNSSILSFQTEGKPEES